ncbi:Phage protein [Candidatus Arthromitus sp. SFB-mouse-NL]|uniref:hypothetical protein n=1 Tax=Candidatus Arthromitus sp. SFB-mouse-NL TaxID=1508644 RepID=UPI00049A8829|nr:hypothetical protein [Candidatus Arthromitus sp. SFB-mouse-NL]AID44034.1 Phage protein [Candidatus Arthromitus sp. SFB-mouse-NL]
MKSKYGKLFKNLSDNTINCFEYGSVQEYYPFIQRIKQQGFNQCIITSDVMISIIEHFILRYNAEIISINFMVEDSELQIEINNILGLMRKSEAYWSVLKQRLLFLSENDCVEMKEVEFKICSGELNTLLSVKVNGVIVVGEFEFYEVSNIISTIIEDYLDCKY